MRLVEHIRKAEPRTTHKIKSKISLVCQRGAAYAIGMRRIFRERFVKGQHSVSAVGRYKGVT